jgi:hypothetical protein
LLQASANEFRASNAKIGVAKAIGVVIRNHKPCLRYLNNPINKMMNQTAESRKAQKIASASLSRDKKANGTNKDSKDAHEIIHANFLNLLFG